ncbi:glycosyl hydrolase family 18 protein [Actinocorallia longicatena]|uniref:chitinase n=1 Tax=Actinocorallia longicatena TaxID=111803 RepID=A0ABP6Q705_9ACTN
MRRLTTSLAIAALFTPLLAALPASADTPSTATFVSQGDWGSGFQGAYTIKAGSAGLTSWKLEFDLPAGAALSSVWDADYTRSGQHYTLVNKGWNGTLAAGATVSPGFVGAPGGGVVPSGCKLNGNPCDGGGGTTDARPTAPTGLASTAITENSVALAWQAGTDDKGVTGYNVYNGATKVATVTGLAATVTGLASNASYTFTVKTVDTANQESDASAPLTVRTTGIDDKVAPSVPAGLTATASGSSAIGLSWTASTDNVGVTGYDVYRGATKVGTATGTSYTDSGLTANTAYTYTVRAKDAANNVSAASASATATTKATDPPPAKYEKIGYFTQWGVYGRNFHVKNLQTSGAAKNLTTIQYAFANVNADGKCFEVNALGQGDSYADYQRSYDAASSVDGVADKWDDPLRGNFGQLKRLKALNPHLKVNMSIGGWTWSKYFSDAALTDASRKAFVSSCIDMFLKGNLPVGDGAGGTGAAYGVFDGFDIDWEWPGSTAGEVGNVVRPEDKQNFTLMLAEFRRQLDAYGAQVNRRFGLTFFMPANPHEIEVGLEVDKIHQYLDYGNVQGYDFHGRWETTTNHHDNLYDVAGDPNPADKQYSIDKVIKAYKAKGFPAQKLTVGMPMYGFGWTGVPNGGKNGLWQTSTGLAQGTVEKGVEDFKNIKNLPGTVYRDPAGSAWKYDGTTFWNFMDPQLATLKANYVKDQGLGGAMFWSLDGDDATASLSGAVASVLK